MIFIAVSRPAEIIFGHAIPFPGLGGKEEENKVSRKKILYPVFMTFF